MSRRALCCCLLGVAVFVVSGGGATTPAGKRAQSSVNTGAAGSSCKPVPATTTAAGSDASLDSTSLGSRAPAAYEIGLGPQPVRRVMILVHGGGWYTVGRAAMRSQRAAAARWREAGWMTVAITYRGCKKSIDDVTRFYDLVRERVGPMVPICLAGSSAGAHLALMVATRRSDVACVIAQGAPTDLRRLARQGAAESEDGGPPKLREGSAMVQNLARAAFGKNHLRSASPLTAAGSIRGRLLLATSADDPLIPQAQATTLATAVRASHPAAYVDAARLASGSNTFVHASISDGAATDLQRRIARLVAPFGRVPPRGVLPPPVFGAQLPLPLRR